jgi:hypothetical protein
MLYAVCSFAASGIHVSTWAGGVVELIEHVQVRPQYHKKQKQQKSGTCNYVQYLVTKRPFPVCVITVLRPFEVCSYLRQEQFSVSRLLDCWQCLLHLLHLRLNCLN